MELIIGILPIRSNIEVKPSMIYKWIELVTWGEMYKWVNDTHRQLALVNSIVLDVCIERVSHFG